MAKTWRYHAAALMLLALVGVAVINGYREADNTRAWPGVATDGVRYVTEGALGTRAFGYGALVLVGTALSVGPLARLWPRRLSGLLPYRRAMGVWGAVAAGVHLLFVIKLISFRFYELTLTKLFFTKHFVTVNDKLVERLTPSFSTPQQQLAWVGAIALAILLVIALTSNDWVQNRLGQAAWKLIQQQSYTAMLFIALHLLVMRYAGKLKLSPPLLRWAVWVPLLVFILQVTGFVVTVRRRRRT